MTRADMADVRAAFVRATEMAEACGFDMVELHCAHGYLLSAFITPLMNRRADEYGGSLENRLRFPLDVFVAMRRVWPQHKPMSVRISATDWAPGGITGEDRSRSPSVRGGGRRRHRRVGRPDQHARQAHLRPHVPDAVLRSHPQRGRDRDHGGRQHLRADHVNSIIAAGRADLCCLARPHLADPYWTLHAAARLGYDRIEWPVQYLSGRDQYVRNLQRAAEMAIAV